MPDPRGPARAVADARAVAWLADACCRTCRGTGATGQSIRGRVCNCVWRRISRIVISRLHLMAGRGPHWNHRVWSRDAEYSADVWLVAKRSLSEVERIIYCEYLLHQRPWRDVEPGTKLGRGEFFHSVYRTEAKIGRACLEAGILPHNYFAGIYHAGLQTAASAAILHQAIRRGASLEEPQPPLSVNKSAA